MTVEENWRIKTHMTRIELIKGDAWVKNPPYKTTKGKHIR